MIRGITIQLLDKQQTGTDAFNRPVYAEVPEDVENVLVSPMTETEVLETLNLTGRKAVYQLCLPKGDTHDWTDKKVQFFGKTWHVIGETQEWIESMVPLGWNRKIRVERIDGKEV